MEVPGVGRRTAEAVVAALVAAPGVAAPGVAAPGVAGAPEPVPAFDPATGEVMA